MDVQKIEISSFPEMEKIARKVAVIGKNEDYLNRSVTLICKIEHYDLKGIRLNTFAAFEKETYLLVASDASKVNPKSGALVLPDVDGKYPEGLLGQYTWLKMAVESGANPFKITVGAVLEADGLGRFR